MSPETFHHYHRPIRDRILSQPSTAIIVCCSKLEESQIIGWIAVEKLYESDSFIVHYLYVKQLYKNHGIARDLFNRAVVTRPVFFSHLTDKASKILRKLGDETMHYIPHLI
jgi:hypothetical protein